VNEIAELQKIDILSWLVTGFLILSAINASATIIGKFSETVGRPVKWVKRKNEERQLIIQTSQSLDELWKQRGIDVEQSIKHDERLKNDLQSVSNKIDTLSGQITSMQRKIDETEMAKLKDTIITYYKKYKDIGEWSKLEKEAFWDLFESYESHGGNGFIHSIVEPVMRELNVID
jgi:vacuolar-type H+-ATPase subunit I/STV1